MNIALLTYNVEFQARRRNPDHIDPPKKVIEPQKFEDVNLEISKKTKKLFTAINNQIEEDWGEIKRSLTFLSAPKYVVADKKDGVVTIQPMYGGIEPELLMEFDNDKYCERLIFSRSNPEKFKYEKSVTTDYGSATLKSFDSSVQKNNEMIMFANEKVSKYIPKVLKQKIKIDYFGIKCGGSKPRIKVII